MGAIGERTLADDGDALTDHQLRDAGLAEDAVVGVWEVTVQIDDTADTLEGLVADGGEATGERKLCQARAIAEGFVAYIAKGRGKTKGR